MEPALAIVQARMSSTRLPGKTLAEVGGEPMLSLMLRRVIQSEEAAEIVIATSDEPVDDPIERVGRDLGVHVFRGERDDVLTRFARAAAGHVGPVIRLTADCPLIDPSVLDEVVRRFRATPGCAYASNIDPRTFPDGLDVEVVSAAALAQVSSEAAAAEDREHVTTAIRRSPDRFPAAKVVSDVSLGDLRWTVDTPDDLEFVRLVVDRLGRTRHTATMWQIIEAVRASPSLAAFRGRRG